MKNIIERELADKIVGKLHDLHAARLGTARFTVEGWREDTRVIVRCTLARPDKTLHYPMEAGVTLPEDVTNRKPDDRDLVQAIEDALWLGIDFIGYYVERYLDSGGEVLLPLDWQSVEFGDRELFVRGWERNLALEEAADAWLAGEPVEVPETPRERRKRKKGPLH